MAALQEVWVEPNRTTSIHAVSLSRRTDKRLVSSVSAAFDCRTDHSATHWGARSKTFVVDPDRIRTRKPDPTPTSTSWRWIPLMLEPSATAMVSYAAPRICSNPLRIRRWPATPCIRVRPQFCRPNATIALHLPLIIQTYLFVIADPRPRTWMRAVYLRPHRLIYHFRFLISIRPRSTWISCPRYRDKRENWSSFYCDFEEMGLPTKMWEGPLRDWTEYQVCSF